MFPTDSTEQLVNSIHELIFVATPEGKIRYVNEFLCTLLAYREEELIGRSLNAILYNSLEPEELTRLMHTSTSKRTETLLLSKNGRLVHVLLSGFFTQETNHTPPLFVGIGEDMTVRLRVIEALQESQRRFHYTLSSISNLFFVLNRDGIIIEYHQPQIETEATLPFSLVIGKTFLDVLPGHIVKPLRAAIDAVRETKEAQRFEFTHPVDDLFLWFSVTVTMRPDDQDDFDGAVVMMQDITVRKRAEQQLRTTNRRLEQALDELRETQERMLRQERMAAVGQLSAGIAHDFNNILAAITLYTQLLLKSPELPLKARRSLNTILEQAERAATLTQQILDFSRRGIVLFQTVDLAILFEGLRELLRPILPENVHLEIVGHRQRSRVIEADPVRLKQVFVNLATNARDAMPEGGKLSIVVDDFTPAAGASPPIEGMPRRQWFRISVSDTGCGIPPDKLPYIFEPFFTTKEPGQGSGLGLAQVHGIVNQHGGYIQVQSEIDEGTKFTLYYPAASET